MYGGVLPKTGAGLTMAGVSLTMYQLTWLGIALAVAGGAIITASKLFPRIAIEPLPGGDGRMKLRLTLNGRPVRRMTVRKALQP